MGEVEESGDERKSKEVFPVVRKENEECGLPDRCTAENDALVVCLRAPETVWVFFYLMIFCYNFITDCLCLLALYPFFIYV